MTLYEELGVPPEATPDTIREAYRNVARLLHPDAQTNPVLKECAEVQMKRINHLYEVLSNSERRRRYDEELAGVPVQERPETIIIQAPPRPERFQGGNRGTIAWLAVTAIGAMFIIWLATHESSAPAVYPPPASGGSAGASLPSPLQRTVAVILPGANLDRQRADEIARLRAELSTANSDRERLMGQIASMDAERKFEAPRSETIRSTRVSTATLPAAQNMASLTPAPLAAQTTPVEIPVPVVTPAAPPPSRVEPAKWAGAWTYRPLQGGKIKSALFPPEFIETVISEENGHIRGQYHARFKVARAKISPDVDFQFEGSVSGMAGRFFWTGAGGAQGEVRLRLVSDTAIEVVWTATSLGKSMGLASGTAVLNRKN